MKIYLACVFEERAKLFPVRDALRELGHEVVSTWIDETKKMDEMSHDEFWFKLALKDLTEIKSADLLVLDTLDPSPRGGKEVEFGYALGKGHHALLYIVGPRVNVFHHLADKQFGSWADFLEYIAVLKPQPEGLVG